ncbi:hypothetical protein BPUN_1311 [Candidatus Paraburkholderia kirkii]|nr:hypothetical protein BPUN_1311 [Candidatus Paraburkholderia kirkii]
MRAEIQNAHVDIPCGTVQIESRQNVTNSRTPEANVIMYMINLRYTGALAEIDDALEAHRIFLERYFAAGVFVIAGPKVSRDGGIILASGIERERLDEIIAEDPFARQKLAHYDITEFKATRLAPGLNLPAPSSES